ncbi:MAG: type II toxin-antitoxin system HicA family toxin [Desulfuromonadales bacterium]|nr:type II toxin-antitoxin system HicA family toxin [Desulfuromonadales bacterium]
MSKREKLIQRFLSKPTDFSWGELKSLLEGFGYSLESGGKTGGSRVKFLHVQHPPVILHKPHPTPILKRYQVEQIAEFLKKEGLL